MLTSLAQVPVEQCGSVTERTSFRSILQMGRPPGREVVVLWMVVPKRYGRQRSTLILTDPTTTFSPG